MTEPKEIHEGKVLPPSKGPLSALDGFNALRQVVDAAQECWTIHERESTKRARLQAYEQTEIARIKAGESLLRDYFEQVFKERRSLYDGLFERLDRAITSGDGETVHAMLRGIVDVAKSSPIADMGDLSEIRKALDDPDIVWEL